MKPTTAPTTPQKTGTNQYRHGLIATLQNRKYHPASRSERLASWNQRMQSLFTRQAY